MEKLHRRLAALILPLAMGVLLFATGGMVHAASERASATLHLMAVVSPKIKLQVTRETIQIAPTMQDLDRGYLEVPGAAELLVWTNIKNGLSIIARAEGDLHGTQGGLIPLSALSFSLNGEDLRPFTVSDQIVYVGKGQEIRSAKRIDYRLNLDWRTEPDTYAVNITFTVMGN